VELGSGVRKCGELSPVRRGIVSQKVLVATLGVEKETTCGIAVGLWQ
jgi:hypothetical protein